MEHNGDDPRRIAKLIVKRPENDGRDPNNYVVHNGVNGKGAVSPIWKDNANFFEYLVHAPGATLKGTAVVRQFTIKEEVDGGWWKQHNDNNSTKTEIPGSLRFKYH